MFSTESIVYISLEYEYNFELGPQIAIWSCEVLTVEVMRRNLPERETFTQTQQSRSSFTASQIQTLSLLCPF